MADFRHKQFAQYVLISIFLSHVVELAISEETSNDTNAFLPMKDLESLTTVPDEYLDQFDLNGFLKWSIENSDVKRLAQEAESTLKLSPEELAIKRQHIKDVVDAMRMPSDSELMKRSLSDLDQNFSLEIGIRSLYELLELIEPIDNSIDFVKLGGLSIIDSCLNHSESEIRVLALWVLGVASQNNPFVQNKIVEDGIISRILNFSESSISQESLKALFSLSACLRNNKNSQIWFYSNGGQELLARIIENGDSRAQKKVVSLLADLARNPVPGFRIHAKTLHSVTSLLVNPSDLDLVEKTLLTVEVLVMKDEPIKEVFKVDCNIEKVMRDLDLYFSEDDGVDDEYKAEVEKIRDSLMTQFSL